MGDPSGAWISGSDHMQWHYIISHSACGAASISDWKNYSKGSTAPANSGKVLMTIKHDYWTCGN